MDNQQHPITPPPELVQQWHESWYDLKVKHIGCDDHIATQAARWGADQELEACCHLLRQQGFDVVDDLRNARRPKPPSLAEEALKELDLVQTHDQDGLSIDADTSVIRRALERLQELEKGNE